MATTTPPMHTHRTQSDVVVVGLLTGCGGSSSGTPAAPTTVGRFDVGGRSRTSAGRIAARRSGHSGLRRRRRQFAKYAPIVCERLAETLARRRAQNVAEVYRAALVTTLADGRITITELADATADAAVVATCASDYSDFLERADMPDLSGSTTVNGSGWSIHVARAALPVRCTQVLLQDAEISHLTWGFEAVAVSMALRWHSTSVLRFRFRCLCKRRGPWRNRWRWT